MRGTKENLAGMQTVAEKFPKRNMDYEKNQIKYPQIYQGRKAPEAKPYRLKQN